MLAFANFKANFNHKSNERNFVEINLIDKPIVVTDSEKTEVNKKVNTNHIAAKDSVVEKEQIRRGTQQTKNLNILNQQNAESVNNNEDLKKIDNAKLLLSENELNKFSSLNIQKNPKVNDSQRVKTLSSEYKPFRQNRLFEKFGSSDYLPQIQEGEVTLLNAKADQYAVFVRRVAIQVFSALRANNWSNLGFIQARQAKKFAVVEAKMDRNGKLVSIKFVDSSGSKNFDLVLQQSVKTGLWDQNPQMAAALEDGYIHFIFQAKTWAEIVGDPGRERRWLLLATGLK